MVTRGRRVACRELVCLPPSYRLTIRLRAAVHYSLLLRPSLGRSSLLVSARENSNFYDLSFLPLSLSLSIYCIALRACVQSKCALRATCMGNPILKGSVPPSIYPHLTYYDQISLRCW